jgi:hypothetical protein
LHRTEDYPPTWTPPGAPHALPIYGPREGAPAYRRRLALHAREQVTATLGRAAKKLAHRSTGEPHTAHGRAIRRRRHPLEQNTLPPTCEAYRRTSVPHWSQGSSTVPPFGARAPRWPRRPSFAHAGEQYRRCAYLLGVLVYGIGSPHASQGRGSGGSGRTPSRQGMPCLAHASETVSGRTPSRRAAAERTPPACSIARR